MSDSTYNPTEVLKNLLSPADAAAADAQYLVSAALAEQLDAADELGKFRDEFHIPRADLTSTEGEPCVYLCGNSLGLQPTRTSVYLTEELDKWKTMGVEGHFRGARPWATVDELVTGMSARVVGAKDASEVAVMNSLSVNLHLLLTAFYRPTPTRFKIFVEQGAFCSDFHVVKSQIALHGYDPETALVTLAPRAGETYLRTEDITAYLASDAGASIATVLFPGVQFYTGQAFDIAAITKAGLAAGARVGFDLAHAAGNIELQLHDWGVDFAAWCSYKYLNAGPGSIAGAFVHSKHDEALAGMPRLAGWWGQELKDRFSMSAQWQPKRGAQSFQLSNPAVVAAVCLQASLEVHDAATMPKLRAKSQRLTAYLEALLALECGVWSSEDADALTAEAAAAFDLAAPVSAGDAAQSKAPVVALGEGKVFARQLTPRCPAARGAQISLLFNSPSGPISDALQAAGVVCDERRPNVLRVSPAPLYNSFKDVWRCVRALKQVLGK